MITKEKIIRQIEDNIVLIIVTVAAILIPYLSSLWNKIMLSELWKTYTPYLPFYIILFYFIYREKKIENKITKSDNWQTNTETDLNNKVNEKMDDIKQNYEQKIKNEIDKKIQENLSFIFQKISCLLYGNIERGFNVTKDPSAYNECSGKRGKFESIYNEMIAHGKRYEAQIRQQIYNVSEFLNIHQEIYKTFRNFDETLNPLKARMSEPETKELKKFYKIYEVWLAKINENYNTNYDYILW